MNVFRFNINYIKIISLDYSNYLKSLWLSLIWTEEIKTTSNSIINSTTQLYCFTCNKRYHMKVLLNSFHWNGHSGFYSNDSRMNSVNKRTCTHSSVTTPSCISFFEYKSKMLFFLAIFLYMIG